MHADLRMIPHESALFSISCKLTLWGSSPIRSLRRRLHLRRRSLSSACGARKAFERIWHDPNSLIFMHFHVVLFGNKHEIWSKLPNGKVRDVLCCFLSLDWSKYQSGVELKLYSCIISRADVPSSLSVSSSRSLRQ